MSETETKVQLWSTVIIANTGQVVSGWDWLGTIHVCDGLIVYPGTTRPVGKVKPRDR